MNLTEAIKAGPYAWPGGYPIIAVMDDGAVLCHDCLSKCEEVHENGPADGWRFEAIDIHWEGHPEQCAHCNVEIPSAYGPTDDDE